MSDYSIDEMLACTLQHLQFVCVCVRQVLVMSAEFTLFHSFLNTLRHICTLKNKQEMLQILRVSERRVIFKIAQALLSMSGFSFSLQCSHTKPISVCYMLLLYAFTNSCTLC